MADISQIKLPDNSTYDIKDSGALQLTGGTVTGPVTFSDAVTATGGVSASSYKGANSIEYIKSTQTGKTSAWTGNTQDTALYDGKTIIYALLQAPEGNASLNLTFPDGTTSGAKPIYRYGGTTRITTHYSQGSRIVLVYDADNGRWNSTAWYYTGSDNKLALAQVTSGSTYYPIVAANSTSAATRQFDTTGFKYYSVNGEANSETPGQSMLVLGNNSAVGVANNKQSIIRLWGANDHNVQIYSGSPTEDRTATFPDKSGTIALTSDIPDVSSFITDPGVTKITTTVGTHTAITNATGAVSFNVPTKTSHLTNDSGFLISSSTLNAANLSGAIPSAVTATTQSAGNNSTKIATTAYVDGAISGLPTPMQFIGTVGTNGTTTWANLPAASGHNGYTYKVITAHTAETDKPAADVGDALISNGTEWIVIPAGDETATQSATTGISIAAHGTGTVIGVQSTTTTASKVTVGSSSTDYGVKSAGSASTWTFEEKTIPNVTSAGTASSWTFEEKTIPNVTAAGSGSASLTFAMDTTDTKKLKITFSHTHTAPTIGTAIKVQSKSGGSNGTAPTLGTAIKVQSKSGGANSTAPTLGSKVPTVSATDVTVPIKNASASTFVTGTTHTVTDNGHTHTI